MRARLQSGDLGGPGAVAALMAQVGRAVAALHDGNLAHGDLTTSNMVVREPGAAAGGAREVALIDFGLASSSANAEDKGVDLYVLERAFTSAHSGDPGLFEAVLEAYKASCKGGAATLNKFAEVRMRGRKRTMVG